MKNLILTAAMSLIAAAAIAIPAKKTWTTVRQSDGSTITVAMVGDERLHYYVTTDNTPIYKTADNRFCYLGIADGKITYSNALAHEPQMRSDKERTYVATVKDIAAAACSEKALKTKGKSQPARVVANRLPQHPNKDSFRGSKKAPVILACFSDKSFAQADQQIVDFYNDALNKVGYNENGAAGSVHDYFGDMSRGEFDLKFDVIGPVRLSKSATYYGGPSVIMGGTDHIGEFITEAVKKADQSYDIDWTQYDWNGDGEVEQVFVLYAGYGQATGGETGTIWPCAWRLNECLANGDGEGGFSLDGVYINQFACSNELYSNKGTTKMGIGVFCHEFSHCMGLPDMYDTSYGSTPTMGSWDLLAHGSYNGPAGIGWCPAGWTSYERAYAGWLTPVELQPGDVVKGMTDLEDPDGKAYIIYNDNHKDEFYLLENHKNRGWDAYTPESGLLAIHVDYDEDLFRNNIVNTRGEFTTAEGYDMNLTNDHPRMAPLSKIRSIDSGTYYYTYPMEATRGVLDSITDNSKPAAELYNALADGSKLMGKPVYNIRKDKATGDISFSFMTKDTGEETAINGIATSGEEKHVRVFDITGKTVRQDRTATSTDGQKPGIYIKVENGRARKILVK